MSTQTSFDLNGLERAISRHDCRYHLALYADDAQVEIVDTTRPDAPRQVLQNKPAIGEWLDRISAAAVDQELRDAVVHPGGVGYTEECRYADGSKVLLECSAEVRRGQISRAAVTLVHVPASHSAPRGTSLAATKTAGHSTPRTSPWQNSSPPGMGRHIPGNFVG